MKKIMNLIWIITSMLLVLTMVNAAQDFTISTNSVTETVIQSTTESTILTITNTGDESINLTITENNLVDGANTITLNSDITTVTNLAAGAIQDLDITFDSGTTAGIYVGSIVVANTQNTSQSTTTTFTITVSDLVNEPSVMIKDYGSTVTMILNVDDSSERESFYIVNNGNSTITDIEIDIDRLDGGDDDIDNDDIEINGEPGDETYKLNDEESSSFSLAPEEEYKFSINIDIPSNLDVDDYKGDLTISYNVGSTSFSEDFTFKVIAESDNEDVFIDQSSLYVLDGVMLITAEEGENVDDYGFTITNDNSYDVTDIRLQLDGDLQEESSSKTIPASAVTFNPSGSFDIYDRDDEDVDVEIIVPDEQSTGTYIAEVELISSTGKTLDTITLKVKITGDIYIKTIEFDETAKPGDSVDVEITVKNQGSTIYRTAKITGSLFDVDSGNSDIHESSSTFILDTNEEKTEILRFKLPEDASDGDHTLEIMVTFGGNEITELETIRIERPTTNIVIDSFAINPRVVECNDEIYSYIKFRNLGKYDLDVKVKSDILGTNVYEESSLFELNVDDIEQTNHILDISTLEAGTYTVEHKITYNGLSKKETSTLTVIECKDTTVGIDVKEIDTSNNNMNASNTTFKIFGNEVSKNTAYLGSGLGLIILLIAGTLFLL